MAEPKQVVKLTPKPPGFDRQAAINRVLCDALEERNEFEAVMVVALVKLPENRRGVRCYHVGMEYLERIGLLDEAKETIRLSDTD